jgi:hypothetical protein
MLLRVTKDNLSTIGFCAKHKELILCNQTEGREKDKDIQSSIEEGDDNWSPVGGWAQNRVTFSAGVDGCIDRW